MSINMEKSEGAAQAATLLGVAYTVPRVNLLPPEITAARTFRRVQVGLGACVVLVIAGIAGAFVVTQQQADAAAAALAVEQAETSRLQAEQAQYAEVPQVLAEVDAAQQARATALSGEVLWFRYLNDLALAYPADVWLSSLTASVAGPTGAAASTSADPLATPGLGTVSFTGAARTNPDLANWLDVLSQTPGFADPTLTSATRTEIEGQTIVDFTTQVVVTSDALSHRFDPKAS